MTPECKILFPDLPPYIVVFGPTVKASITATVGFPGIPYTFYEYSFSVASGLDTRKEWLTEYMRTRGYGENPVSTVYAVLYSDCEPSTLSSLLGKNVTSAFAFMCRDYFEFVTVLVKFGWNLNPHPGIPQKYRYTMEMKATQ